MLYHKIIILNVLVKGGIEGEEHLLATLEMEASKHEEELLAEALLLQEEFGVNLADHVSQNLMYDCSSTIAHIPSFKILKFVE